MAADSGQYTPETIARRIAMAEALLAPRKRPITHWAEGLDELAKGALGGYQLNKAEDMERRGRLGAYERIARLFSGDPAPIASSTSTFAPMGDGPKLPASIPPNVLGADGRPELPDAQGIYSADATMMPPQGGAATPQHSAAISSIESGGRYDALGPVTKTGDRAYGKHQVMGSNIGSWTQEILGRPMTPEQFLNNPKAQDAVFNGKFGQYVAKYGPEGAARAWFAGEGGMNDLGRKDQLGTTVGGYGQKFAQGLGGGQGGDIPAIAQALQPTAQDGSKPPQPPAGAPAAPESVPVAPPMAQPTGAAPGPVAGPTGGGGTGAGGTGGNNMAAIAAMLTDPWVDPKAAQAAMSLITPNMNIQTLPDGTVVGINPRDGSHKVIMQAPKNPKFVPNVGMDRYGQAQPGFVDELKGTTRLATPEVGPGASAANAPSDPSLVGEDYLKTLDKPRADQVRAIVEGRSNPPGSFALKTPYWQRMMQDATQFEPGFDMTKWSARAATAKDFASGKSAQNITSFNTVLGHLDTLDKAAEKLKNTDYPWANAVINPVKRAAGSKDTQEALSNFNIAKQAVIDELTRAFRGTGGNVHDLVQWEKTINSAGSPTELKAATRQATELLRSRIEALGDTYKRGMNTQRDPVELLSPRAQQTIRRLSGETTPAAGETVPTGFKILKVE